MSNSNKKSKNQRAIILVVILIGLLIIAYKIVFVSPPPGEEDIYDENTAAIERVETILLQIENINFDISVFETPDFRSMQNIAQPLISLPTGKSNPFAN